MPQSWAAEKEVKLLLTVIKTMSPTISRATWEEIAATMGTGYTHESVRQKFQNMKKDSEAVDGKAPAPNGPKAVDHTVTKKKTAAIPTAAKGKTTTVGKKRKAPTLATDKEDDFYNPAKARKLEAEKVEVEDRSCMKVKTEAEFSGDETFDEA